MIGLESLLMPLALTLAVPIALGIVGIAYLAVKYTPKIVRIFEDRPVFMPLKVTPNSDGELIGFPADDGVRLSGNTSAPDRPPAWESWSIAMNS